MKRKSENLKSTQIKTNRRQKQLQRTKKKQLPRQQILKIKDMQHESHQCPDMSSYAAEG
jgi:hypothetical protein